MKALTIRQPHATLCVLPRPWPDELLFGTVPHSGVPHRLPFKTIETRSWPAPKALIGERIAIHAGKTKADYREPAWQWLVESPGSALLRADVRPLPLGAIVGTAVLTDCVPMEHGAFSEGDPSRDQMFLGTFGDKLWLQRGTEQTDVSDQLPFGDFAPGWWAWLLADAVQFSKPIPCRGRQRLWNLPAELQWLAALGVVDEGGPAEDVTRRGRGGP